MFKKNQDDYDWKYYDYFYEKQLKAVEKIYTQRLKKGDYVFSDNRLLKNKKIKDLHPNYRILYETVLQLNPRSVMEIGCGAGDHLYNLNMLNPKLKLNGLDVSNRQIAFLRMRSPNLKANIYLFDITLPVSSAIPKVELCYTQAVIMHIKTGKGHLVALSNAFNIAAKHVILMENWKSHNFMKDIEYLFEQKIIRWDNLYFYYKISPELKKPHLMIVSKEKLPYNSLTDYKILLKPMK